MSFSSAKSIKREERLVLVLEALKQNVDVSALIIAVVGALLSIASALYFTSRKISAEFRYRRYDLSNTYAERILSERLRLYPDIWKTLSAYAKLLERFPTLDGGRPSATRLSLKRFNWEVQEWDNQNAYILSANSSLASGGLIRLLRHILIERPDFDDTELITRDELLRIKEGIIKYELALRTDIGVYEVEDLEARKPFLTYIEVIQHARRKKKKA